MEDMHIPVPEDPQSRDLLDTLVAKGILDEVRLPGETRFCITAKGERLLALTQEFAQMVGGGRVFLSVPPWGRN